MKLRHWQQQCINKAITKFKTVKSHFLCLATPGAGKTVMAATLASRLFQMNKIDLVICFSPSNIVASDFKIALETHTGFDFSGGLGSFGASMCYHKMQNLDTRFWALLKHKRVFVIFDEIHHCSGNSIEYANSWGEHILSHIQGKAEYTLALTGTPWRSDKVPIALSNYCLETSQVHCDFKYGLQQAIKDGVCRAPKITALDNHKILVSNRNADTIFRSFSDLLANSDCSYKSVIEHPDIISHLLKITNSQLTTLRVQEPDSAGLIVASSIEQAHRINLYLLEIGEKATVVTYKELNPEQLIREFKNGEGKWIISVGMISEGTDIPRLKVCCYLSVVKTELYFRQVLGRVMRVRQSKTEIAYFYMPAHPLLVEYADRLAQDIPECGRTNIEILDQLNLVKNNENSSEQDSNTTNEVLPAPTINLSLLDDNQATAQFEIPGSLDKSYDFAINSFGRFRQEIFEL